MSENEENENKQGNENVVYEFAQMVERAEKANTELKALLEEQKKIASLKILGGQTNAGIQPEKPKEETPKEYLNRILGRK